MGLYWNCWGFTVKRLFLTLIFITPFGFLSAGNVLVDNQKVIFDDKLSMHNYFNWDFKERPEYDFSNKVIYASVFTNETPNSVIFSSSTQNVTFIYCHLENIVLPLGSTVINPDCDGTPCWTQSFKVQSDSKDWYIDDQTDQPIDPVIP
jgi:hypothetical protein